MDARTHKEIYSADIECELTPEFSEILHIKATLDHDLIEYGDAIYSGVMMETLQGHIDWSRLTVTIDGKEVYDQDRTDAMPQVDDNSIISEPGDSTYFSAPGFESHLHFEANSDHYIEIRSKEWGKRLWQSTLVSK